MIDLHVHTNASDGQYDVERIIEMASEKGIDTISIVDHDTVKAVEKAIKLGKERGINVIPGIEVSASYIHTMHILGYYIDIHNTQFLQKLQSLEDSRDARNRRYIEQFHKMGIDITMEDVRRTAKGTVIGKPHFARALAQKGYINDYLEAFSKFFSLEEFEAIKREGLQPQEVIKLILDAGGIPVLAHPKSLRLEGQELERKILELKSYGLQGIECYYSYNTEEQVRNSLEIARRNNMLITGGTDYHGEANDPELQMGTGINNNVHVPQSVLTNLMNVKRRNERSKDYEK